MNHYIIKVLIIGLMMNITLVYSVVKCVDDGVCMTCNKDELVS